MGYLKELKDEIKEILKRDNISKISISNNYFDVEFFDKKEEPPKTGSNVKPKKDYSDTSALDKLYEQPPTQAEIDAELEERNRKLREKFNNQGNVIPTDGVAAWSGDEE